MANHCHSVQSLEKNFTKAAKEKKALEGKLEKAVGLQKQLAELKLSKDFMPQDDIVKLREETTAKEIRLARSFALHQPVLQQNEERITSIKNSKDYRKPKKELQIKNRIQFKKSVIEKAANVQRKIIQTENNPEFLTEAALETMKEDLNLLNEVLKKIQIQDQNLEEAINELLCVNCSTFPEVGTPVYYTCLEHHILCIDCVNNNNLLCQICNQMFGLMLPRRNVLAERMIRALQADE